MSASEHPEPELPDEQGRRRRSRTRVAAAALASVTTAAAGLAAAVTLAGELGLGESDPSPLGATPTTPATTRTGPYPIGTSGDTTTSAVDEALATLEPANIAFNTPTKLRLDEQEEVQLLVSRRQSIDELEDLIEAAGEQEGAQIEVSDVMIATLSGRKFDIERITEARQPVAETGATEWAWTVAPTEAGTRLLHLTLSALVEIDGSQETYTVQTFRRAWTVEVPWHVHVTGFAEENWQWLWTAILVPLAGVLWHRRRSQPRGRPVAGG